MAEWEALKIHEVVKDISDNKVVLPVIQRDLVWDEEKMELLFDSLLKGNSFGGIMSLEEEKGSQPLFAFRQFSKEGEIHDSDLPSVLDHNTTLIIDGQQRLQTFYMGLKGGISGKILFFNILSQIDYEFAFASQANDLTSTRKEDGDEIELLWYPVQTLYPQLARKGGDDRQVAKEIIINHNIQNDRHKELVFDNVRCFERAIFGFDALGISKVYIDRTNPDGERRRMVELFRRLNDGGTRLSALDLAASMFKSFDYRLEGFLRREIPRFSDIGFGQDEVIKLIFLLQDNHTKEVTDISKEDADFAVEHATRILKVLDILRQLLNDAELYEYYHGGGRSVIPLNFVAYHIFHKPESNDELSNIYANYDVNNPDFTNIKRWLFISLLNGVFSRGKGWTPYITGVRKILNKVSLYKGQLFPAEELFSMYESHPLIFSSQLSENQLTHWDVQFTFYLMYDRHNLIGRDIDHIQPKSILEQANISSQKIHSQCNYQLLDEGTNRGVKRAKPLNEWLKDWDKSELEQYLERHLIPRNPQLWLVENYDDFLSERSKMIVTKIRQFIPLQSIKAQLAPQILQPVLNPSSNIAEAAWLTREERDPEAWLQGVAEQRGYGEGFHQIVEVARSLGLYARFQNNWWVVKITLPQNRMKGLFDLSSTLEIWLDAERIALYLNYPVEYVREKLDCGGRINPQDVSSWTENLRSLFLEYSKRE